MNEQDKPITELIKTINFALIGLSIASSDDLCIPTETDIENLDKAIAALSKLRERLIVKTS